MKDFPTPPLPCKIIWMMATPSPRQERGIAGDFFIDEAAKPTVALSEAAGPGQVFVNSHAALAGQEHGFDLPASLVKLLLARGNYGFLGFFIDSHVGDSFENLGFLAPEQFGEFVFNHGLGAFRDRFAAEDLAANNHVASEAVAQEGGYGPTASETDMEQFDF